jgi:hypothetical protein
LSSEINSGLKLISILRLSFMLGRVSFGKPAGADTETSDHDAFLQRACAAAFISPAQSRLGSTPVMDGGISSMGE